jgi:hypothetical protein
MTARSGDALSHVYFHARQNAVFDRDQHARILPLAPGRDRTVRLRGIGSCRICMAAMRRHRGTNQADPLHLPFTCLNLFGSKENCIRK